MKGSVCLTILACLAFPAAATAGDDEARAKLQEAFQHWNDPDPQDCLKLVEEAEAAHPDDTFLYNQVLLTKAAIYHVKTGDLDKAEQLYDTVIRNLAGAEDLPLKQLKADAMVRKGNLVYSEKGDTKAAFQLFIAAHQTFKQATTADVASQLSLRLSQEKETVTSKKEKLLKQALTLAEEAVDTVGEQFEEGSDALRQNRAKFMLQKALVQQCMDLEDDAHATWDAINKDDLSEMSTYQQAMLHVLWDQIPEATDLLKQWMNTRKTIKTRNQARKFIRNEPMFQKLLKRKDWEELTQDENPRPKKGIHVGGAKKR